MNAAWLGSPTRTPKSSKWCWTKRSNANAAEIHAAHPHLSLAQIHAALAFYHDHQGELEAQVQRQIENYRRLRTDAAGQLTRAGLQERLAQK